MEKMTGQELADASVAEIFPQDLNTIHGFFNGPIVTVEQAQNILWASDSAREVGLKLSVRDMELERQAYNIVSRSKNKK